ncbi:MAG: ABC transporter ATP-binding protein, partial [Caldisericia bacterium]|nr:ABC transporter ATP-binding protein [Caldisericia bacterium]
MKIDVMEATFGFDRSCNLFENFTFSVDKGDILFILGPNGCGKTTLLKCITNALKLRKGHVFLDNEDICTLNRIELAKKIAVVHQTHKPTFPYSVLQVVLLGRSPHLSLFSSPSEKDIKIAKEAIKTVNISHLMKKPYTNLSGGEMQLTLIARALAQEPRVLILDEPTSHLDFKNQMVVLSIINRLAKEKGLGIIATSHDPNHSLFFASKVLIMHNKKILAFG